MRVVYAGQIMTGPSPKRLRPGLYVLEEEHGPSTTEQSVGTAVKHLQIGGLHRRSGGRDNGIMKRPRMGQTRIWEAVSRSLI